MIHLIALCAALVLAPVAAFAQQSPGSQTEPAVVTSGEGVVQAMPDRAWIQITAESRARNPRDAQRRNAEVMQPVLDKLRGAGVPADAIKTVGYDLQQEWDYVEGRRVSRGFVARNTVEVRVDDIEKVGSLLEIAVESGATSVGGVRFGIADRAALEREALGLAVADARARADAAAAAAGRSVDRIVHIAEHRLGSPPPMVPFMAVREAALADAPPIAPGQMEVRAQVTLTAILK